MSNKTKVIIVGLVIIIIVLVVDIVFYNTKIHNNSDNNVAQDEYISEDNGIMYKNNSIVIVFKEDISEEEIEQIVNKIPGTIHYDKSMNDLNIYQINIQKQDLSDIELLCNELDENELIEDASPEYISEVGLD